MQSFLLRGVSLAMVILSAAVVSRADTTYGTLSDFNAQTTGRTVDTFNGIAAPASYYNEPNPFTISGITFTTNGSQYANVNDASYYPVNYPTFGYATYNDGGYLVMNGQGSINTLTITFGPSTAFGFNSAGVFGPENFVLTLSDGSTYNISDTASVTGTGTNQFFGVVTSTPITSATLTFANSGNNLAVDDVTVGNKIPATPEPASLTLLGTGVAALAGIVRRRRK